jgi:hypothetical protein
MEPPKMSNASAAAIEAVLVPKSSTLDKLPPALSRQRILSTEQALESVGVSPANWRHLRALGLAPAAIKIGLRKQGYLLDWMKSREQPVA